MNSVVAGDSYTCTYDEIFRLATVYKGGNRYTAWYAAIDTEWPRLRGASLSWLDPSNVDRDGRQRTRLSDLTQRGLILGRH